jgi:AraC-like DNA-binding protein
MSRNPVEPHSRHTNEPAPGPRLTQAGLVQMKLLAPPPAGAHLATTFYRMRCDEREIRDVQPSSIGIIALMKRGSGRIGFIDGTSGESRPFFVVTPTTGAATLDVAGPWDVFGAMLSPVGWASLTGQPASANLNRLVPGDTIMPALVVQACEAILGDYDDLDDETMVARLAEAMRAAAKPIPSKHLAFIGTVGAWLAGSLSPDLDELYARSGYGRRQAQRLAERYFGLPLVTLGRKYRALRAAVILSRPDLTPEQVAAVEDHFYDQSHMIREIRIFAGRTPARIADPDTPYLSAFLDVRDFGMSGPRLAPIPPDLRA